MNPEEKLSILTNGMDEVVTLDEAKELLAKSGELKASSESPGILKAYWGIEPSGLFHIGQALVGARKVRELESLGFEVMYHFQQYRVCFSILQQKIM